MDTGSLIHATRPVWVNRCPDDFRSYLSAYSSDTHVGTEQYFPGSVDVIIDFGRLTYRVIKDTRYLEEDRFYAYLTGVVDRPVVSSFAPAAKKLPALSNDVVPASFPSPG